MSRKFLPGERERMRQSQGCGCLILIVALSLATGIVAWGLEDAIKSTKPICEDQFKKTLKDCEGRSYPTYVRMCMESALNELKKCMALGKCSPKGE